MNNQSCRTLSNQYADLSVFNSMIPLSGGISTDDVLDDSTDLTFEELYLFDDYFSFIQDPQITIQDSPMTDKNKWPTVVTTVKDYWSNLPKVAKVAVCFVAVWLVLVALG